MASESAKPALIDIPGMPVEMGPPPGAYRTPWRIARRRFAANRLAVAAVVPVCE